MNFQFFGEALAFDFVNTDIVVRRKPVDLLSSAEDLLAWWQAVHNHYHMDLHDSIQISPELLVRAKAFRSALRRIFDAIVREGEIHAEDLTLLNGVLREGHTQLVVAPNNRFSINQVSDGYNPMLLTIAHSALWLLTECERERLHKCKNEHCVLMFLDTTKNGNRVWCSIECMNRARSTQRYQQGKDAM